MLLGRIIEQVPVVQSSLRGQLIKCLTTLYPNTLIFLLKKMGEASHIFQRKILAYFRYFKDLKF